MANQNIRVRFAPSPTGALHIGGVRTALYNYLFARKNGGKFILRIEDTDSQRFVPGAEQYIIESLAWCGIQIDEGVSVGGPHAPYRQSERKDIYRQYAEQLVESGDAYYAFDTPDDLDRLRKEYEAKGETFAYDFRVRGSLETSLKIGLDVAKERVKKGDAFVVRFKIPENEDVQMDDIIRGKITINTSTLDDKVLFKSADMLPTYHLANIVDDHLMQITHVIRGEEWLPSLPLHYLLYRAFGWEDSRPEFAHLPLLLKPQGQGKLSKRDGDKFGFPVFPLDWTAPDGSTAMGYREQGYLPEAFINMLALLGWNPGTEQEIFSMQELIETFSLEKVSKSGARFSHDKAKWFNAQYIRKLPDTQLATMLIPLLKERGIDVSLERAEKAVALIKERITFPVDMVEQTRYLFEAPTTFDEKSVNKFWTKDNVSKLKLLRDLLSQEAEIVHQATEQKVHTWVQENSFSMGQLMNALRISILGVSQGPSIFAICDFIGKDETLRRVDHAIATLGEGK